jgi:hypothetical protein
MRQKKEIPNMQSKRWKNTAPFFVFFAIVLLLMATGCTTAQRGEAVTASAGHSPIIQMQAGVHFYSSNTRPIQAPEYINEAAGLGKFADTLTLGAITVTTTTTISSGDGGVETTASDTGEQAPSQQITPTATLTP